ncbi:pilus assembly PilX N-terminal domain-containing protein [uncultured Meiothermus sp.]|uniref:pilus assembly PilX N-terminal domain-containing protein n=1 Tax=uncultured Meiothermus sp. TaxID=157471 RepID=UPI002610BB37|nr:pilus assembly PilX N-terminal domain-containing protein [uncultured Meiothermus sp.]
MPNTKGITLVSTLVFMFIVIILVSVSTLTSLNNRRNAQDALRTSQAQFAAEAGLERAVGRLWHQILASAASSSVSAYAVELNRFGLTNGTSIASLFGDPQNLGDGSSFVVRVSRQDDTSTDPDAIVLTLTSTGTLADGTTRRLRQVFRVDRAFFPFDFALLTNNAECIFCHLDVKSLDALRGNPNPADPSTWWRRARVGVLESLIMRDDEEAGVVHGSLLARGTVSQQYSGNIGPSNRYRTTMNPGDTRIRSTTLVSPTPANCSTPSNCLSPQNLYYNYPDGSNLAAFGNRFPDGELPDRFPLPIADTNNNRLIDDVEWNAEVSSSLTGTNESYSAGTITASMTINPGGSMAWPGGGSIQTLTSASLGQRRSNVILDGSVTPIALNGTVFIDGDVVIRGRVRGNGTLLARGNVYVMGDLTYDCGTGSSLAACDYSTPSRLPQLNLIAGGNAVVGDYMTIDTFNNDASRDRINMLSTERNQQTMSFCQTNPSHRACSQLTSTGRSSRPNLALTEIANFNRRELQRWLRNNSYRPRFYTFGEDRIFFSGRCYHDPQGYGGYSTIRSGAQVSFCRGDSVLSTVTLTADQAEQIQRNSARFETTSSTFDNATLKNLWADSMNARGTGPLRTDGLLYSANAIFGLSQRRYPKLNGRWDLRGGLVAADTGIFVPGPGDGTSGLTIYHDNRLRPRIATGQQAQLNRGIWEVVGQ